MSHRREAGRHRAKPTAPAAPSAPARAESPAPRRARAAAPAPRRARAESRAPQPRSATPTTPESAQSRGRHRAEPAPKPRYATVATTAVLGAGLVTFGSGASSGAVTPQDASPAAHSTDASKDKAATPSPTEPAISFAAQDKHASRSRARRPLPPAWVRPGTGYISSTFAMRWGRHHDGIDLAARWGAPIYAAGDGVVVRAGASQGFGNLIAIRHDDGVVTWYGHEEKILVAVGERVRAGQRIALVGSLGNSTGPHLHFEVHVNGQPVDPIPWLRDRGVRLA